MILPSPANLAVGVGIALCAVQTAIFSGLNLAIFSVSRLRLEVEAAGRSRDAARLLRVRADSNFALATILWGNVATNVLLTLLSGTILTGVGAFIFSTVVITILGEIIPQAYFSRNALRIASRLTAFIKFYQVFLFVVAKPTALLLDWWLGPETMALFRERDFQALMAKHVEAGTDVGRIEAKGALNFLDLDDIAALKEGEPVDPRSIVTLPVVDGRPALPKFERAASDPFLRQISASGRKWTIFVDQFGAPQMVLDAHHFLHDVLFEEMPVKVEAYWHRPIVVTDPAARLGEVIGLLKVSPEQAENDLIDHDVILVWGGQRRIITGADLFGRLLRGIAKVEVPRQVGSRKSLPD